jgi:CBS domain-containing protein
MIKVKDIMSKNPAKIEAVKTVRDACALMTQLKLGSLMVCKGKEIIGILEESDFIRNVLAKDLNPYVTKVERIMSVLYAIDGDKTDDEASEMMCRHNVRHLAVTCHSDIAGIISMLDLIRPVYSGKSFWV